ncbi:alpha/beta fold hydrolase [Streptomyces griseocarneus]|uniref:alpha/beta fold hydrolase n=1 Tax=Streptomyces griseocarneus TaxID=51201 RepID=UPI003557CB2E
MSPKRRNVVFVHGGFVDGSGWQGVHEVLKRDGYNVSVVQNPTLSLEGDVAATRQVIDAQDGQVVLVGHSYGGAVISEAGNHPKVSALVYIAAFAPDKAPVLDRLTPKRDITHAHFRPGEQVVIFKGVADGDLWGDAMTVVTPSWHTPTDEDGWRLAAGGWRLAAGGWRLAAAQPQRRPAHLHHRPSPLHGPPLPALP